MNRACLVGRMVAKPEFRYTNSNIGFTNFTIAINRPKKEDGTQETDFINCRAWRKTAEVICKYFDKGNQIGIEGRIQTGSYEDKDGNKRYTTDVVVDNITFLDKKGTNNVEIQEAAPIQESDPFADFGESVSIDDNFLD